ncbi:hypothetical protein ACIPEN_22270 [Herbaspirillum chlorophenolicum]|uniref:XRE family transcriptional regulator n=1 Tax=Herbaspirillum chlorophenolicum TaxID=211589 RepID=A0ABW8F5M6_9BURK
MKTPTCADFKSFYSSLSASDKAKFAECAGTTKGYISVHLVYARRMPRKDKMEQLFTACQKFGAKFDKSALIAFFYEEQHA